MIKSFTRNIKSIFVFAVILAVAISFMPITVSVVFAAQTNDAKILPQVERVTAINSDEGIILEWAKISKATEYQIYRQVGNGGDYELVGTSKVNRFSDSEVAYGKTYSYKIRACQIDEESNITGPFSQVQFSRASVVSSALAWLGCKESNGTHKKIIDVYNKDKGTKVTYGSSWSAIFVSAVAATSNTTPIIATGSNCSLVCDVYKNDTSGLQSFVRGSRYIPKAGDIVFFDWGKNGKPNNIGIVASVSGKTVKTIEGNLDNAVGYRTFPIGYSYVLGYGLPNYDEEDGIVYLGSANMSIGCEELTSLGIGTEPEGYNDLGKEYDFVEQKVKENLEGDQVAQYDKMVYIVNKVKANAETKNINCSKAQYYAAFIYKLCQEAGIDASIVVAEGENGNTNAWVEVALDGQWYKIGKDIKIEKKEIEE